ncbi:MAG: hypothetical protein ACWA5Q_07415 [bacterium]
MNQGIYARVLMPTAFLVLTGGAIAAEFSGNVSIQGRYFTQDALDPRQSDNAISIAAEPEWYWEWDDGNQTFTLTPFARLDSRDSERTHWDIREALWIKVNENHEWAAGIGKVFWGVTESVHLVDIVNQTDLVENPDGEQKLGQPMVRFSTEQDWGTVDLFVLPGFRERTFAGEDGRLRPIPRVDGDQARYESSAENKRVDLAARWSHAVGDWDLGVSGFHGTSRDPLFQLGLDGNERVLVPYYPVISQVGLDVQATKGDWLWKLETVYRHGFGDEDYMAAVGGFEYTLVGISDTDLDLGLLLEYQYDDRSLSSASPFQDDVFMGMRLTFNDAQSTDLLAGVIQDLDTDGRLFNVEASTRVGDSYRVQIQARFWSNLDPRDPSYVFRDDDYIELDIARYF